MASEGKARIVEEDYRALSHLASIYEKGIKVKGKVFSPWDYDDYIGKKLGAKIPGKNETYLGSIRENFSDNEGMRMIYSFIYINGASTAAYEKLKVILQDKDPKLAMDETL